MSNKSELKYYAYFKGKYGKEEKGKGPTKNHRTRKGLARVIQTEEETERRTRR